MSLGEGWMPRAPAWKGQVQEEGAEGREKERDWVEDSGVRSVKGEEFQEGIN